MAKKRKNQVAKSTYSKQQKIKEALLNEQLKKMPPLPVREPEEPIEEPDMVPEEAVVTAEAFEETAAVVTEEPATAAVSEETEAADTAATMDTAEVTEAAEAADTTEVVEEPAVPAVKRRALLETLWFGLDYGSILTAFSLTRAVEQLGWEAVLMNKPPVLWTEHYDDPNNIAGKFIYKYCQVEPVARRAKDLSDMVQRADAVVVGSDIIWSYDVCTRETHYHYYLDFVADDKKKISYASSFGFDFSGPFGEELKACAKLLQRFNALSVSNYHNLDILRTRFGLEGEIVLDPVFLCDKAQFEAAAAQAPCIPDETDDSFIFTYIKYGTPRKREFVLRGNDILTPNHYSPMRSFININTFPESRDMLGLEVAWHITVEDWLYYLQHSEFVITDDYYGVCFAIIFNKPFVFIESVNYEGMNQVKALLSSLHLEERIVHTEDDFKKKEYLFRMPVRYKKVNSLMEIMKEQSLAWLQNELSRSAEEVD